MKRFTLLRHAKSDWSDRRLCDHDRPLAPRGLRDAPRMGDRLADHGLKPDLILTSSAKRARETARLVEPALSHAGLVMRTEPALYLASTGTLLEILCAQSDGIDEIVLVGHNPAMTELANRLLPSLELVNLPTAGSVSADCTADRWTEITEAEIRLRFLDYPKKAAPKKG